MRIRFFPIIAIAAALFSAAFFTAPASFAADGKETGAPYASVGDAMVVISGTVDYLARYAVLGKIRKLMEDEAAMEALHKHVVDMRDATEWLAKNTGQDASRHKIIAADLQLLENLLDDFHSSLHDEAYNRAIAAIRKIKAAFTRLKKHVAVSTS